MEVKKSHKADLEHLRPWMFLGAFVIMGLLFILVLEVHIGGRSEDFDDFDDDIAMDLNIKPNDQRDMIAAAEKTKPVEQSEILNKVDNLSDLPPEILDVVKFQPDDFSEEELLEEEKEEPINQNADDPETLRMVQELPMYPGGMVEFMKWLTKTLKYPDEALRSHTEGKVMVNFIVESDGSLTGLKVVQSAGKVLDAEALRVMRLMPRWQPGKDDKGRPCRTLMAIPIVFEI